MARENTSGRGVKVTLVKSVHGQLHRHRATAQGLGLRRIGHSRVVIDTPATRGLVKTAEHLLTVEPA